MPLSVCVSSVRGNVRVALIWRFHIARLVGLAHSFSAAHNSCPAVWGSTAVLTAWVTLDKTPSVGSGVLTALRFKSWLCYGPATGILDTFPEPVSLSGWDLPLKALPKCLLHQAPRLMLDIITHCPGHLDGHVISISRSRNRGREVLNLLKHTGRSLTSS